MTVAESANHCPSQPGGGLRVGRWLCIVCANLFRLGGFLNYEY